MSTQTRQIEQVIDAISKVYKADPMDVVYNKGRKRDLVECRQVIMYFLRKCVASTYKSDQPIEYVAIAKYFRKNHATVIHAERQINNLAETSKEFKNKIEQLGQMLQRLESNADENTCALCNRPIEEHAC